MSKQPPANRSQQFVTINELAAEYVPPGVMMDFSAMSFQEVKPLKMRWAMLGLIIGWIFLSTAASTLLFLVTKSEFAFAPGGVALCVTPNLIRTISRFLFWGPADYQLEALRLTLKAQQRGVRHLWQLPQA